MKRLIVMVTCLVSLMAFATVAMAAPVKTVIYYDGVLLETSEPAVVEGNRTLLALRDYFDALGVFVAWSNETGLATVSHQGKTVIMDPYREKVYVDGKDTPVDVGPQLIDGKVYVPVRFLGEIFGGTADYTMTGGVLEVKIEMTKPPVSLVSKDGDMTKITRVTAPTIESTGYFFNKAGDLVEIACLGYDIEVRTTDLDTGEVDAQEISTPNPVNTVDKIVRVADGYKVVLNTKAVDGDYVGVGVPSDGNVIQTYEVTNGRYDLYNGENDYYSIYLDWDGKVLSSGSDSDAGYVLDVSQGNGGLTMGAYGRAKNGAQAFLVNEQLVITDNEGRLVHEGIIGKAIEEAKIVAVDDMFFVATAERVGNTRNTLYTAVYHADGREAQPYWKAERFDEQRNLSIVDAVAIDDLVYMLLKTNYDYYLATYDVNNGKYSCNVIKNPLKELVPTSNDYKLFGTDVDAFYTQEIN